jgi:hypothetical protein
MLLPAILGAWLAGLGDLSEGQYNEAGWWATLGMVLPVVIILAAGGPPAWLGPLPPLSLPWWILGAGLIAALGFRRCCGCVWWRAATAGGLAVAPVFILGGLFELWRHAH